MEDIGEVDTSVGIVDDRVAISAGGDATLAFGTPDVTPLSRAQVAATIRVAGEGYRTEIELDADALDALEIALREARKREDEA